MKINLSKFNFKSVKKIVTFAEYALVIAQSFEEKYPDHLECFVIDLEEGICLNRAWWENHGCKESESCDSFVFFYQESGDNYWDDDLLPPGSEIDYSLKTIFDNFSIYC